MDHENTKHKMPDFIKKYQKGETLVIPSEFRDSSEIIRGDMKIAMMVVQADGHTIQFVSEKLKNNKKLAIAAVQTNGHALQHLNESLRTDTDVLMAAVLQNGYTLQYGDDQTNTDIIIPIHFSYFISRSRYASQFTSSDINI